MAFFDETERIDDDDWRALCDWAETKRVAGVAHPPLLKADRRYHGPTEWTGEDRRVQNLRDLNDE